MADDVEGGSTLSEAMAKHPKAFDRLYSNMVRAGELGGVLDVILQRLADFMEKAQALKRKVIGAMIYPVAVITFAIGIVTAIMLHHRAEVQGHLRRLGAGTCPSPRRCLLNLSTWVQRSGRLASSWHAFRPLSDLSS